MDAETMLHTMTNTVRRAVRGLPVSLQSTPMPLNDKGERMALVPNGTLALCWTELAIAPQWKLDKLRPALHIVEGLHHRCVAISVDKRWLCGSGGALALFTSDTAASRFLNMIHLPNPRRGGKKRLEPKQRTPYQCFTLESQGLTLCTRCKTQAHPIGFGSAWDDEWPMTEGDF